MTEDFRTLLYPLGFLTSIAFGGRFALQWLYSELQGQSTVPKLFWRLSLVGNISLLLHGAVQLQYHVSMIQACNAVISWRNLNLLAAPEKRWRLRYVLAALIGILTLTTVLFAIQEPYYLWLRVPRTPWQTATPHHVSLGWHLLGFTGLFLFALRFWMQWWQSECRQQSVVSSNFWWISLAGAILQLCYFSRISDPVNLIGPAVGMIPYLRNLMLLRGSRAST